MKPKGTKPFVVFAHDGRYYSDPTVEALGEDTRLEVAFCKDVDEIIGHFSGNTAKPDIIIADANIPHGSKFQCNGLTTLIGLYIAIRKMHSNIPIVIPIVFFTTHLEEDRYLEVVSRERNLRIIKAEDVMTPTLMDMINQFCPTTEADPLMAPKPFPDGWEG